MSMTLRSPTLIGDSSAMRELRRVIGKVAHARIPVLIQGETGVGKELVAGELHALSGRRGRMVSFNVSAIPDTMFESTLFGHVRGAFTGAHTDSAGLLTEAHQGTAFFDEIGALGVAAQAKLLRALETGAFRPVGAPSDRRSDFRIVAACNEPIMDLVERGGFRSDLAYRLRGCVIEVPPLRRRTEDIPALIAQFCTSAGNVHFRWDHTALEALYHYTWPGNVRQLRALIERLALLHDGPAVSERQVLELLYDERPKCIPIHDDLAAERSQLRKVLEAAGHDTALVARELGVHRSTLYRRMAQLGIKTTDRRLKSFTERGNRYLQAQADARGARR